MSSEIELSLVKFKEAFHRLEEGLQDAHSLLEKDGVIQRFEFTFELCWKALKIYLNARGAQCVYARDCFKAAFKVGLITDEQIFLDMLDDRNKTTHIYDKEESQKIFVHIRDHYAAAFKILIDRLALETNN